MADFIYSGGVVQRPQGKSIPHTKFKDALFIEMTPVELKYQTTLSRGGGLAKGKGRGPKFRFLAPDNIQEIIKNDWETYETSAVAALSNKVIAITKVSRDIESISKGMKHQLGDLGTRGNLDKGALQKFNEVSRGLATRIPTEKIDSPLTFVKSNRREWQFVFNLIADGNPADDVVNPVKDLMAYASPELIPGTGIGIELPWIFEIRTSPQDLIKVNFAALTAVQPTWFQPYIDGHPVKCELTLSFIDMSPLYRSTLEKGGVVRVINK